MTGDLAVWPRVKAAIYATTLNRAAGNHVWPECHRTACRSCAVSPHRTPDTFYGLVLDQVAESVYGELLARLVTEPDTEEDDQ